MIFMECDNTMKVLRLKLFQETACYKKPFALKVAETYPLPPYSTVKGMLHYLLDAQEFIDMGISIQGSYDSVFSNYQDMYSYKGESKGKAVVTQMPLNVHMLYGVNLIIHVTACNDVIDSIVNSIKNSDEHISLGRREDLVRIDEVCEVTVEKSKVGRGYHGPYILEYPIYVPKYKLPKNLSGINYLLNWKYEIVNELRIWEKIETTYVDSGEIITEGNIEVDSDGYIVFFNVEL